MHISYQNDLYRMPVTSLSVALIPATMRLHLPSAEKHSHTSSITQDFTAVVSWNCSKQCYRMML